MNRVGTLFTRKKVIGKEGSAKGKSAKDEGKRTVNKEEKNARTEMRESPRQDTEKYGGKIALGDFNLDFGKGLMDANHDKDNYRSRLDPRGGSSGGFFSNSSTDIDSGMELSFVHFDTNTSSSSSNSRVVNERVRTKPAKEETRTKPAKGVAKSKEHLGEYDNQLSKNLLSSIGGNTAIFDDVSFGWNENASDEATTKGLDFDVGGYGEDYFGYIGDLGNSKMMLNDNTTYGSGQMDNSRQGAGGRRSDDRNEGLFTIDFGDEEKGTRREMLMSSSENTLGSEEAYSREEHSLVLNTKDNQKKGSSEAKHTSFFGLFGGKKKKDHQDKAPKLVRKKLDDDRKVQKQINQKTSEKDVRQERIRNRDQEKIKENVVAEEKIQQKSREVKDAGEYKSNRIYEENMNKKKKKMIDYDEDDEDEAVPQDMRQNHRYEDELAKMAELEEQRLRKEMERVRDQQIKDNEERKKNMVYDRMRERHMREFKINNANCTYVPAYPTENNIPQQQNQQGIEGGIENDEYNAHYSMMGPGNFYNYPGHPNSVMHGENESVVGGYNRFTQNPGYGIYYPNNMGPMPGYDGVQEVGDGDEEGKGVAEESDDDDDSVVLGNIRIPAEQNVEESSGIEAVSEPENNRYQRPKKYKENAADTNSEPHEDEQEQRSNKYKRVNALAVNTTDLNTESKSAKQKHASGTSEVAVTDETAQPSAISTQKLVRFKQTVSVVFNSPLSPEVAKAQRSSALFVKDTKSEELLSAPAPEGEQAFQYNCKNTATTRSLSDFSSLSEKNQVEIIRKSEKLKQLKVDDQDEKNQDEKDQETTKKLASSLKRSEDEDSDNSLYNDREVGSATPDNVSKTSESNSGTVCSPTQSHIGPVQKYVNHQEAIRKLESTGVDGYKQGKKRVLKAPLKSETSVDFIQPVPTTLHQHMSYHDLSGINSTYPNLHIAQNPSGIYPYNTYSGRTTPGLKTVSPAQQLRHTYNSSPTVSSDQYIQNNLSGYPPSVQQPFHPTTSIPVYSNIPKTSSSPAIGPRVIPQNQQQFTSMSSTMGTPRSSSAIGGGPVPQYAQQPFPGAYSTFQQQQQYQTPLQALPGKKNSSQLTASRSTQVLYNYPSAYSAIDPSSFPTYSSYILNNTQPSLQNTATFNNSGRQSVTGSYAYPGMTPNTRSTTVTPTPIPVQLRSQSPAISLNYRYNNTFGISPTNMQPLPVDRSNYSAYSRNTISASYGSPLQRQPIQGNSQPFYTTSMK
ncbi:hypothetical protein AX774_g4790 [Zancudomyces culisetae]|uniref:Uncharacterized protein n=1 Tax=Zancudomyces culisetae TaxID=1213189 RepID=A0A1R1PLB1_ZANCU|nr:hypothetical protein AX774_g4790 [Zancudomyces culisetae]|eukprot:OMH81754.1 hypothetical protein AX774_g4790 [Zancudomyces culisetae]